MVICMSKFEKKFGKYAIRNISLVLIMCYAVGYVIQLISPSFLYMLTLDPYQILHGQVWRIFTWIVVPPDSLDIFTILMLYVYYSIGNTLEYVWGTYQYNVYLFMGMLFTIVASFLSMGLCYALFPDVFAVAGQAEQIFMAGSTIFSTYYINMSILLAYALTFPTAQMLFMFLIPIRMKWLGIAYTVLLVIQFISGTGSPLLNVFYRGAIGASLLTVLVFFLKSRNHMHMTPKQIKRRQEFKHEVKVNSKPAGHKCTICGRTDEVEGLEFRYCSKCAGNHEYCHEHLFTHEHVK